MNNLYSNFENELQGQTLGFAPLYSYQAQCLSGQFIQYNAFIKNLIEENQNLIQELQEARQALESSSQVNRPQQSIPVA